MFCYEFIHLICSLITDQTIQTYQSEKNSTFALGLFDLIDQQPVHMAIVDMTYTIEIIVPNSKITMIFDILYDYFQINIMKSVHV
jgi:hypothetical protein